MHKFDAQGSVSLPYYRISIDSMHETVLECRTKEQTKSYIWRHASALPKNARNVMQESGDFFSTTHRQTGRHTKSRMESGPPTKNNGVSDFLK